MAKRITIISNPESGYNARKGMSAFDAEAARYNLPHVKASTPEEIENALKTLSQSAPETLIINAGDGTVDLIITLIQNKKIFKTAPALILLMGGTTNLIHRDVGMKDKPHIALKKIINGNLREITRSPLKIRRTNPETAPLYGFFLGTGAIPRVILKTRKHLHKRGLNGPFSEMLTLGGVLLRLKLKRDLNSDELLKPVSVKTGNKDESQIFMALTTLEKLIPSIKSPASDNQIGMLYMNDDRHLKREQTSVLSIEIEDPWVLDGEMQEPGKIEITLGDPVRFLI
ncbi:MAG: diacylglycerol kinase family protein [Alphaproteobacteria bacterium]